MANKFFPVSIDLNNKNVLIIGAGKIALRKVETLLNYNCNIIAVSYTHLSASNIALTTSSSISLVKLSKYGFL